MDSWENGIALRKFFSCRIHSHALKFLRILDVNTYYIKRKFVTWISSEHDVNSHARLADEIFRSADHLPRIYMIFSATWHLFSKHNSSWRFGMDIVLTIILVKIVGFVDSEAQRPRPTTEWKCKLCFSHVCANCW